MPDSTTVEAIMTRHVVTVTMDDSLAHIREIFQSVRFHHLVVMENGRVVGVISDRDLLKNLSPFVGKINERNQDRYTLERKVHQIMGRRLVSCRLAMLVADAARLMLDSRVSCLPVLDGGGECVGIVTMRDVLNWSLVECTGGKDSCPLPKAA
jgi:acetoin utilization protein AcuB